MRLIDADTLKEYITKAYEEMKSEFKTDKYRDIAKLVTESFCMDIDEAPTVDAVPREVVFHIETFDEMTEEYSWNEMTLEHILDTFTEEGYPYMEMEE